MLDLPTVYCRGYLITPVIEACRNRGLFDLLDRDFRDRTWLATELGANEGHFAIALEALASAGWLERRADDAYRLAGAAPKVARNVMALYEAGPEQFGDAEHSDLLTAAIEELLGNGDGAAATEPLLGAVVVPLVEYLERWGGEEIGEALERLGPDLLRATVELLRRMGWLAVGSTRLAGSAMARRRGLAAAAAYRPVLRQIPELLFGDSARAMDEIRDSGALDALRRSAANDEGIVEGLQLQIAELFTRDAKPPQAVVDLDCADGALLESLFRALRHGVPDGRTLRWIGFDRVGHAVEVTEAGVVPLPSDVRLDDIRRPGALREVLASIGIAPEQEVAYLRPFVPLPGEVVDVPEPVSDALAPLLEEQPRFYVDSRGRSLGAASVLASWQQSLRALAKAIGPSRLLTVERHAAAPDGVRPWDDSAVLPVDWLHRLVHEHPITAEAFVILAAGAGLFDDDCATRVPRTTAPCLASVHRLTGRDFVVRHAQERDLDRLCELEALCWRHSRTPRERIRARLQTYPQGQLVLEKDEQVLGAIYSQRIADPEALMERTTADVHELHDVTGAVVQLLAVNVDPQAQNASHGDQLLEVMLQRCSVMRGVERVVGVTLCKSYDAAGPRSFDDYMRQSGSAQDPVLAFHQAHGAAVVRAIPGYRPEDHANRSHGVLVSYDILARPRRHERLREDEIAAREATMGAATPAAHEIDDFVRAEAARLLGVPKHDLEIDCPVMEMGLDSADLLKLQRICEERLAIVLDTGFFFEHGTIRKVIDHLAARVGAAPQEGDKVALEGEARMANVRPAGRRRAAPERIAPTDIGVIGMACRLPGGIETTEQFWRVLADGQCVIGEYPRARGTWPSSTEYPGIDQGGFVADVDAFDAAFFRISPAEAQITDPQQRMLLQLAWRCLEDAGVLPSRMSGSNTGVFVGASNSDYARLVQDAGVDIEAHAGVGSAMAILANRISYFFDWSGPSLVIDTACSSSLFAVHSAVHALRSGECAMALAGGVNLICHPDLSIAYHKAGMLAADGRCKTFDAKADGYVRSEGAVLLLLKPLAAALADGNRVHAIIKGTATNHGGLASGLTVPNPQKQKELLVAAWKDAGIVASHLTYIEAHGTGTALGDPIEIQGIQSAYAELGAGTPIEPCGIGSVKSNLGHLESAAGITGLLKVILSMQHRQVPPSVNFSRINPKIRMDETSFFIAERLRQWNSERVRTAGVSSFGSGGSNAHVVLQEYHEDILDPRSMGPYVFVLSAANADRLGAYARDVLAWLEGEGREVDFSDAIFTWQVGRTAMRERLAIKVTSPGDLLRKLRRWTAGDEEIADLWTGPLSQKEARLGRIWQTSLGRRLIEQAMAEKDADMLGALWASGITVDWRELYSPAEADRPAPRIISLPTYPFEKERYWIDIAGGHRARSGGGHSNRGAAVLHPLLHANTSNLMQQSYSSSFTGAEFFLADHQIRLGGESARKVLPGVAYLEMVRAAVDNALPARPETTALELRNTVWVQPIVIDGETEVRVSLFPGDDDHEIEYEVHGDGDERPVYCRGLAVVRASAERETLDLDRLREEMDSGEVERETVYAACAAMGLQYGPSFRSISAMGQGNRELLARLRLPATVEETWLSFVLHPSILDGGLQAAAWLLDGATTAAQPRLPFALESLLVFSRLPQDAVAWVRYSPGGEPDGKVVKLDIDLCDKRGTVCVRLRGYSCRLAGGASDVAVPQPAVPAMLLAAPAWTSAGTAAPDGASDARYAEHHVLLCDRGDARAESLGSLLPAVVCQRLECAPEHDAGQRHSELATAAFERIQSILRRRPRADVLVQIVSTTSEDQPLAYGLAGLLKSAARENPHLVGQLILVSDDLEAEGLSRCLKAEMRGEVEPLVRYERGVRQVLRWRELTAAEPQDAQRTFRNDGVYLITGGLGALGRLFAAEIVARAPGASVVLTGRSQPSAEQCALLDDLSGRGAKVSYRRVDLGRRNEVEQLVAGIEREHGRLDGVLHSAGMIADDFISRKATAQFSEVLIPKVAGTVHLDLATRDVALEFFVLFSSVVSVIGNVGQADYAAANGFLDAFAEYRNRLVAANRRHGRTVSIDWPLWEGGGMQMDAATREALRRTTGLQPMRTATGISAFDRSLRLPHDQILVLEGDAAQMRRSFLEDDAPAVRPRRERVAAVAEIGRDAIAEKTEEYLRRQLATVLRLPSQRIDRQGAFEEYGIDSMLAMKLTNALEESFGSLPKTLFFEYRSLPELTDYFTTHHAGQLAAMFAPADRVAEPVPSTIAVPAPPAQPRDRRFSRSPVAAGPVTEPEPIAIIGLSGRYSGAVDIEAYWRNLRDGTDSIVEVPAERWDWQSFYSEDRTASGRHYSRWGGFIEGVDQFDPLFFHISPKDAKYIDPQERLFLLHAWMAVEDAGYTRATLQLPAGTDIPGQVGVYVGVMWSEYQLYCAGAGSDDLRMGFSGNLASIANRVSYALNLHGPSMTLDTMCSSSLTAIHVACQDLKLGRTSMAIAGGVNVSVHPNKYLQLSVGQFISGDGHCQSFGEGGDGYIPGEGVGVVVLKRLSEAKRDADHIYGVIRGSALTHGGRTNGYTVPNPQAQTSAISRALAEARTDARHISYVEAHGTGTKLGDPIEIAALAKAFHHYTSDTEFCRIGSAKSNIGHCEAAAGIAGVTKVLLQMRSRQIVPSLHSTRLNPNIDFSRTPFVVNQTLQPWEQPVIGGRTYPRIAGISSFGAGGSNAHMILEEYDAPSPSRIALGSAVIPLSARTPEQLQKKAADLLDFLTARLDSLDLAAVAYTLQVGREAMEERLAFVVSSIEELAAKLRAHASGEQAIEDVYQGQVKRNREAMSVFSADDELQQTVEKWLANGKLGRAADVWVKGVELDWSKLYGEVKPQRITLPTYPFAAERYWIDTAPVAPALPLNASIAPMLHPLLHRNVSDLSEQRYSSTFTGEEPVFADRRSRPGADARPPVLPNAAQLEMVRAAVDHAMPSRPASQILELRRLAWAEPIAAGTEVSVALLASDTDHIAFEIYSRDGGEEIVHSQGGAAWSGEQPPPAALDLERLRKRMGAGTTECSSADVIVHRGDGEMLVELRFPAAFESTAGDYEIHPVLLDRALAAALSWSDDAVSPREPLLPASLDLLRLWAACAPEMVAWVRRANGDGAAERDDGLDIDLADRQGNVAVQMRGLRWGRERSDFEVAADDALPPEPEDSPRSVLATLPRREIALVSSAQASATVPERKKPAIALAAPAALPQSGTSASPESSRVSARPAITLTRPPLGPYGREDVTLSGSPVRLYDRGSGIFSIEIGASRAPNVVSLLSVALDWVRHASSAKVLLLNGIEHCFPRGGREEYNDALARKVFTDLASFPSLTVAILQGDVLGAGFVATAVCDLMVGNEIALYGLMDGERGFYATPAEAALLAARFGAARAAELAIAPAPFSGRELRVRGWTSPFLPWSEVEGHAERLAATLAAKSRAALRLLKQHLGRRVANAAKLLEPVHEAAEEPETLTERITAARVRVETPAAHVLAIGLPGSGTGEALDDVLVDVHQIFAAVQRTPYYRAIVVAGDGDGLLPPIGVEALVDLQRIILESEVPVIAALERNATGHAWLAAVTCDGAVYARGGVYSTAGMDEALLPAAVAAFRHRFGREAAAEILLTASEYSGRELQNRVGAVTVAEDHRVLAAAVELASSWARVPRRMPAAWRMRAGAALHDAIRRLPAAAEEDRGVIAADIVAPPSPVPLESRVVSATAHPGGIVVLKMEDRDARNMFSSDLVAGLREAFAHIGESTAYKVVILTGFDAYFATGGTKETLLAIQRGEVRFTDFDIYDLPLRCKVPVIAAVQGHAIGAGWSMAMFADIVLLSEESGYVSPYMDYGFTPGAGATYSLPDKLGPDLARESLLTAQQYLGRELKARGVKVRVLPRAEVPQTAMALARQIARTPRSTSLRLKEQLTADMHEPLAETYCLELAMHDETFVGRSDTLAQIEEKFQVESDPSPAACPEAGGVATGSAAPAGSARASGDAAVLRAVTATLKTLLAGELQMLESDVDEDAQFVDLGLDSISGVTWVRKINAKYGTAVEATKVYGYPTLVQLARYVMTEAEARGTLSVSEEERSGPGGSTQPPVTAGAAGRPLGPNRRVEAGGAVASRGVARGHAMGKLPSLRSGPVSRFAGVASSRSQQPIAVIGMAGQFPQAKNLDEFWDNLASGRNCIREVPPQRWDVNAHYRAGEAVPGKSISRWAGVIEDYDSFDPLFFNISPLEAESMDPQQRLFLQTCWNGIEDAGYDARALSGRKCGVFVGCTSGDYHQLSREHQLSAHGFTGSATSILAARISYLLNLQGPCVSIDTACSSSLVALAHACDSLASGASELALAGGVYVMIGPEMHIKTSQAGMLSPDGRCYTFDQRANGFVPGEGVGVVLLKRLADAKRDRDIIHAVIQGWGVNQDGKTNGITAPNPESQTRLEQEVYDAFGVDPTHIGLVEAHGTGTKLGDPIEVEGLRSAFRKYTEEKEYCALGSVKSNIGHCLAAAGIAGVLKVVLSLKHAQLPPTINFELLNEHITLAGTPFYVNNRLRAWERRGRHMRQAATSSFGFSGTNAHVVIGEYAPPDEESRPVAPMVRAAKRVVPLSARNADRLKERAADLLAFIRRNAPSIDLVDLAYTLQVGREPMEDRLGIMAESLDDLALKLQAFLDGQVRIADVHRGQGKRKAESTSILTEDEELKERIVENWIATQKLSKLIELWVDGLDVDWHRLYGELRPRRITLPSYPFAKERYWIDGAGERPPAGDPPRWGRAAILHPVLHSNTSDLTEHRYSSTFAGDEFFLADHRVRMGTDAVRKLLPGVVYLEMARAAARQAAPEEAQSSVIELRDTVWLEPVIVSDQVSVSIALSAEGGGRIAYDIYTATGDEDTVHCRGHVIFSQPRPEKMDLEALRGKMTRRHLDAPEVYDIFARMGLHYGPAHQGIKAIHIGERQLLAELRLPHVVAVSGHEYVLHPSLLDGALQSSIGLIVADGQIPSTPTVPFSLQSLRILSPCTTEMVAWVRQPAGSRPGVRSIEVDIDLCDAEGKACVQARGLVVRIMESTQVAPSPVLSQESPRLEVRRDVDEPPRFDRAFYRRLVTDILDRKLTVDEAAELG